MRMSSVPAKFAAALVFGVAAAATSTTLPVSAAPATDNCLLEPTKDALPQGQHWYYRIERGTGRKCWYTRDADDKAARAETPAPEPAEKPVPRRAEAAPTRSLADAHAEIAPRTRVANEAPAPATAPSVWPSPQAAMSGTAAPAASSQPDTPLTVADATV